MTINVKELEDKVSALVFSHTEPGSILCRGDAVTLACVLLEAGSSILIQALGRDLTVEILEALCVRVQEQFPPHFPGQPTVD